MCLAHVVLSPTHHAQLATRPCALQVYLSTINVEMGLPFEAAEELIDANKKQIAEYGSRVREAEVGFYVRKTPKNILSTGYDHIILVTGMIRRAYDGGSSNCLIRHAYDKNASKSKLEHTKMQWKPCKNLALAEKLWRFWYKCAPSPEARTGPAAMRAALALIQGHVHRAV